MTVTEASSMLDAALSFALRGWAVFPCSARNKAPLLPRDTDGDGKVIRGTGGVSKASTDPDQIRAWWERWPNAMIGIAAGRSGLLVIDFDPRVEEVCDHDTGEVIGTEEWTLDRLKAELEAQIGCPLPASLAVRTPSGGVHIYFRMPEGDPIGNKGNLPQHVDVRGEGGYVIAPPSYCVGDGARCVEGPYRWLRGDADAAIVDMPAQLVAVLREGKRRGQPGTPARPADRAPSDVFPVDLDAAHRRYAMAALDRVAAELAATPPGGGRHGGRNKGAYQAAFNLGGFVGAGALSPTIVRTVLIEVVRGFDRAAFDKHIAAIDNGLAAGEAQPHDLSGIGQRTRRRESAGSAGSSDGPPLPPVEAYADDFHPAAPGPGDDAGAQPFQSGTPSSGSTMGVGGRIAPIANDEVDRACARLAMTDLGNAERFYRRHGGRFRFCPELGWFAWDERRWELLSEEKDKVPGRVSLAVFDTVRAIRHEADLVAASGLIEDLPDDATDDEQSARLDYIARWKGSGDNKVPVYYSDLLRAHALSSEGSQRLGCVANLVKSFPDIAIAADAMNADRMAINVANGTLRLTREGNRWSVVEGAMKRITMGDRWGVRLDPHRPGDLISKIAGVAFDPKAISAVYDGFLAKVQPDDPMRRFLHQWGGLSLTGDISEQKLAFFHGKGRNGKSTLVDLWSHIAGDYGGSVAIETFLDQGKGRKGGEATPDLARLPGIRFLRTSEPEKGAKLAEALIKLITGGELIDARHLNKGFFSFLPSFKVTISGNHKPKITGHDDGIWRRVMLVPWEVQIARDDVDRHLPDKLRGEAAGVLNRLIEGLLDWREGGLVEPESVTAATAKYREQSDQLGRFLAECTEPVDGARAKSSELFALFTAWAKANGAAEWQQVGFTKAMEDRGFENKRSNGIQWLDIEMVKSVSDFADGQGDTWRTDGFDPDDLPV